MISVGNTTMPFEQGEFMVGTFYINILAVRRGGVSCSRLSSGVLQRI